MTTEKHPLTPFMPQGARLLMLGSFPPPKARWSMDFFYPNWINDMWRIMGYIFHGNKHFFEVNGEKRFDKEAVVEFCTEKGIALYDTACEVRRLKDNASDKFLEIIAPADILSMLASMPQCNAVVTTGEKATEVLSRLFGCEAPSVGGMKEVHYAGRVLHFWRMPSSSRAYPLALDKKAVFYRNMLIAEGVLNR